MAKPNSKETPINMKTAIQICEKEGITISGLILNVQ